MDESIQKAFLEAIQSVESRSSAEVVVSVRKQSGSYLHADVLFGLTVGVAALAFTLFSEIAFSLNSILVDPLLVGLLAGVLCRQMPRVRRVLTRAAKRNERVQTAAHAVFFERGVRLTTGRTGVLVYVSLLERAAEVVVDKGVEDAVPANLLEGGIARIRDAAECGQLDQVAACVADLGDLLEPHLPRGDDDVNELEDGVEVA